MKAHEFSLFRRILKDGSGLNLSEDKQDLVEGKLRSLMRELDFPSLSHLTLALTKPDSNELRAKVAQAVTVQESYFFRDKIPFDHLRDIEESTSSMRVEWCASVPPGTEAQ